MKTTRFPLKQYQFRLLLVPLLLGCCALSPQLRAVSPPPDGGYPNFNTAEGEDALFSLTTGDSNAAIGYHALHNNTTGAHHTAIGSEALANVSTNSSCTAVGYQALFNNTGTSNTAVGASVLHDNGNGFFNVAIGFNAMLHNTAGSYNTATGLVALSLNTTGGANTAYGSAALNNNTTGNNNTAIGGSALQRSITGSDNIALGNGAGAKILTGSSNIHIGNPGLVGSESFTTRIGKTQTNTYIAGISGVAVADGVGVVVGADGHLGTVVSSERYKDAIEPMDKASETILALKPVTFRYKHELDPKGIPQFGLVAEEVAKVNPDLVARDEQGKPYTVRYEAVNAMLLNEFLKEHRKVEQQRKGFEAALAKQQKQIEALTAGLQTVSAQLELNKSAPQTVLNSQ